MYDDSYILGTMSKFLILALEEAESDYHIGTSLGFFWGGKRVQGS